jgi:hypothetical protein
MIDERTQTWLDAFLAREGGVAGTVHYEADGDLALAAATNIPDVVLERVRHVPRGKGMAGLAQVERKPIQTCNIQDDDTGRLKPLAKQVSGLAAAALPVLDDAGQVRAVVGISFGHEGEIPEDRLDALMAAADDVPAER